MDDEFKSELDKILDARDAAKQAAAQKQAEKEAKQKSFTEKFVEVRDAVVRPAMEKVGEHLATRGYKYEVMTKEERTEVGDRRTPYEVPASIEFTFWEGDRRGNDKPGLSVICDKIGQKARFHENKMWNGSGSAGGGGETTLENVTEQLIQKKLLGVIGSTLNRGW